MLQCTLALGLRALADGIDRAGLKDWHALRPKGEDNGAESKCLDGGCVPSSTANVGLQLANHETKKRGPREKETAQGDLGREGKTK